MPNISVSSAFMQASQTQTWAKASRQEASVEGNKISHKQLSWPSVPAQRSLCSCRTHQASRCLLLVRPTNSEAMDRFCDKLESDFWGNCLQFSERKFTEVSYWLKGQEAIASECGPRVEWGVGVGGGHSQACLSMWEKIKRKNFGFSSQNYKLKMFSISNINKRSREFLDW